MNMLRNQILDILKTNGLRSDVLVGEYKRNSVEYLISAIDGALDDILEAQEEEDAARPLCNSEKRRRRTEAGLDPLTCPKCSDPSNETIDPKCPNHGG